MRRVFLCLLLAGLALPVSAERLALVGGRLIDGNGSPPLANSVILVRNERIEAVGQVGTLEVPDGYRVISTEGMSVLPGLWDMHVHLMLNGHADYAHWRREYTHRLRDDIMPASAEQLLMAGVTSARDLGAPLDDILAVRAAIEDGDIPGPTLYVSGPFIQHRPYPGTDHYRWGVHGEDDARARVRQLAEAGVDVIKLIDHDQMSEAEYLAVVEEAHAHGLPVVAHAHRPEEIIRGLKAGVDNFEHTGLSTAPIYPDEVIAALRERTARMDLGPLYWTPTIEPLFNYVHTIRNPEHLDDPCWHRGLDEEIIEDIRASIRHPERLPYFQLTPARKPTLEKKFSQLREAGVTLLIGTDSGVPLSFHCQSTWAELEVWVNHMGMDPMDTIRAATYWPARMMGVLDDVGTIEAGKYADIIAVRGDVLRFINILRDVDVVVRRGQQYR
ncbi:MAG: Xaa-Pro dipeptidase [Wenzhouxiangella sp.]|nr:MAG: Xaa-Pro dipeptidase [Wenzhouxiangella sp.]